MNKLLDFKNCKTKTIELIGNTPLLELSDFNEESVDSTVRFFAKLEMFNPSGSIKDRIALYMLDSAEKRGLLQKGMTIIEASSGNTGTSLAMIAAIKGYKCIIVTPEKTSGEKIAGMRALGADVRICPNKPANDENHYINHARKLFNSISNTYLVDQYNNPDNKMAHYHHTGPEIWQQLEGKIDYLFACSSSGGTISGVGKYLKEKNSNIKIILVDPIGSVYFDYFTTGKINPANIKNYKVEGAGKDIICSCMDFSVVDEVVQFDDEEAFHMCRQIAKHHGLLVGGSSGAAYLAATKIKHKLRSPSNSVIIFPDSGFKYLNKIWADAMKP